MYGVCGALLVQQVHHYCLLNRNTGKNLKEGIHWCYNTHKQWAEILQGFSVRTIRREIDKLLAMKVLVAGNFNKRRYDKTGWYRLDYDVLCVQIGKSECPNWPHRSVHFGPIEVSKLAAPIPESSSESNTESSLAVPKPQPEESTKLLTGKVKVKQMSKGPTTSTAILTQSKINIGTHAEPKNSPSALKMLWQQNVPKYNDSVKFMAEMKKLQQGQLSHISKFLGENAGATVLCVIKEWIAFTQFVAAQVGCKTTPDVPQIGFLLKYVGEARSFALHQVQLTAPKKVQSPNPQPTKQHKEPVQGKPVTEGIATMEDILKWKKKK